MSFWEKIKQTLRSFMNGRNGADHLSIALLWAGLLLYLVGAIVGSIQLSVFFPLLGMLMNLMGFVAYVFCIFRIFSRNLDKRRAENRRYVTAMEKKKTQRRQARVRFQNRKTYKYFKCPGCKAWLRLSRGKGVVTITCSRCHTSFTQKA